MLFTIVREFSSANLANEVQKHIDGGWELRGDIRVVLKLSYEDHMEYDYFQPMTKEESRFDKIMRFKKWKTSCFREGEEGAGISWWEVLTEDGKFVARGADEGRAIANAIDGDPTSEQGHE